MLKVAIVGAGPAAFYAIGHLLEQAEVHVAIDVYEKLPTPWGLVRSGVAPDHPEKKRVADSLFSYYLYRPQVRFFGNVEIGRDVQHAELLTCYNAVIYATGAGGDVQLGIPGEDLPGSASAREFVAWYNGHPDFSGLRFDLSCARAVIIGNGNVALDVARILTTPPEILARTDIADHALAALRKSKIEEVIILGRRGILEGAFHNPELEELEHVPDLKISVEGETLSEIRPILEELDQNTRRKVKMLDLLSRRTVADRSKRVVFRFLASPTEILGDGKVEKLRICENSIERSDELVVRPTETETLIDAGLVLRAIGYRGTPFPQLPFNEQQGTIGNRGGRVCTENEVMPGVYVTGWIKRGAKGIIGSNKRCSAETVRNLLEDWHLGKLERPLASYNTVVDALNERRHTLVLRDGWGRINQHELAEGKVVKRTRAKKTIIADMLTIAGEV